MNVRRFLALGAVLGVLLASPPARAADEAHETLRGFTRTGKYLLWVSRKQQRKARIYHSARAAAFLVLDSDFEKPFLLLPREDKVVTVMPEEVVNLTEKSADIAKDAKPEELGDIRYEDRDVLINVKGELVARLVPRPYLLGEATAAEVLVHAPEYENDAKAYQPDPELVRKLVDCAEERDIRIFFGSWCPTCRRLIPRILRVDQALEGSKIKITYYGLPRGSALRDEPEARKENITHVPTGVVYVDGKRVATISSSLLHRPEAALCRILER